ncbi:hypothetical protein [Rhodococcus rhodnii]|uniref:Uncharacterized protein n=1 Tax=Rhodococcus rhodnii LMG 5362 TaxID=1273125 RepID=R7WR19_9NOCA|nr:hypothetical protein [Rhodococcus rhodnii]EOM77763.1 hypothetical protein Rrhod_0916 [Rhodococcus rhodnii LMG 5362]
MSAIEWTAAMEEWVKETLARAKPITSRQREVIRREFSRSAHATSTPHSGAA